MQMISTASRARCALLALTLIGAGCAETQLGAQLAKSAVRSNTAPVAATPVNTDPTLAPEAFDATGLTIWDGAATLQGIWFAHPLAQRAQRVRVSNRENGLMVEGALFRRDPSISGPSILVSSDAARSLGITPGAATELQIVALREGPLPPPTEVAAAPAPVEPGPLAASSQQLTPEPAPDPAAVADSTAPTTDPDAIALADTQTAPAPARAPVPRPAVQAPPAPTGPAPSLEGIVAESAPLPAGNYLQVGSFSIEPNAALLVQRLIGEGQPARYVNRTINGKPFSVVVIGPLSTAADEANAKATASRIGIKDTIGVTL